MKNKIIFISLVPMLFAVFVLVPGLSVAAEKSAARFRLGALEFHPGAEISWEDDSNIFLTRAGAKSDSVLRYTPEINIKLPFAAESSFDIGFKYEIIDFDSFNDEDTENKTYTSSLKLERIGGNFYSRTTAKFEDTSDPSSSETQSTTGARTPREKFEVDSELGFGGYDGSKLRVEVSAGTTENDYDASSNDRLENDKFRLGGLIEWAISPKTNIRLQYEFEDTEYDNRLSTDQRDDNQDQRILVGLSFTPSALITGHATFGVELREYDKTLRATDVRDRDQSSFAADVDLTWDARPSRTKVTIGFSAGIEDSSTAGQFGFNKWEGKGSITQGLLFISDNLELKIDASIEKNIFNRSSREDKLIKFGADLKYTAPNENYPWFLALNYDIKRKTTNQNKSSIEYLDNVILVKVGMNY